MDDVWERIEATVELLRATGADGRVPSSFYTDMATALMRHARRAGLQSADAEDVAAELLQKIILKLHQFENRGRGSFRAWCLQLAVNFLKNWYRDLPKERTVDESVWVATPSESAPLESAPSSLCQKVWAAYSELSEEEQKIVKWRVIDGLQFAEIGKRLGIPTDTARQKFHRAKKKLESAGEGD